MILKYYFNSISILFERKKYWVPKMGATLFKIAFIFIFYFYFYFLYFFSFFSFFNFYSYKSAEVPKILKALTLAAST
jgi:hypothetical protein